MSISIGLRRAGAPAILDIGSFHNHRSIGYEEDLDNDWIGGAVGSFALAAFYDHVSSRTQHNEGTPVALPSSTNKVGLV